MSATIAPSGSSNTVANRLRREFHIDGIVQGVGFRPFVYGLALRHGLAGYVLNDANGVTIGAEGSPSSSPALPANCGNWRRRLAASIISASGSCPLLMIPTSMANFMASFELKQASSRARPRSPSRRIRGCARHVPGCGQPQQSPPPLPFYQLHPLRPALHHYPPPPLRPPPYRHGGLCHVPALCGGL